jgi:hypothetical protein
LNWVRSEYRRAAEKRGGVVIWDWGQGFLVRSHGGGQMRVARGGQSR